MNRKVNIKGLSVGNIVRCSGKEIKVTAQTILDYEKGDCVLKPIRLSESRIKKFGWKLWDIPAQVSNGAKVYYKSAVGRDYMMRVHCYGIDFYLSERGGEYFKPAHVHTLQNLWLDLTGQEL